MAKLILEASSEEKRNAILIKNGYADTGKTAPSKYNIPYSVFKNHLNHEIHIQSAGQSGTSVYMKSKHSDGTERDIGTSTLNLERHIIKYLT